MENLPEALVLEILSRLDDSSDVARCRLAWNTFNYVSPGLRSINLQWPLQRYLESRSTVSSSSSSSRFTSPLKRIFLDLVSNIRDLESVRIGAENLPLDVLNANVEDNGDDLYLTDGGFVKEWLPRVSGALKSLSISDFWVQSSWRQSEVLSLVSAYCHNLLELEVKNSWLSVENMNPMPMLTTLTLEFIRLDDKNLTELNKCFLNLQVLNLIGVSGLKLPTIQLLNLKTCHWTVTDSPPYLCLITPNLITLKIECKSPAALCIEAPKLYNLHLSVEQVNAFAVKKFENLKIVRLECSNIRSLLAKFMYEQTVEMLTLDSRDSITGVVDEFSKFTVAQIFRAFPKITSLCFNSRAWSEFRVWYEDGIRGLKTFRGYLMTVDPALTFSAVDCVLEHYFNLVDVSLLIHRDVAPNVSKRFITKCMTRWPDLKWRWGTWGEGMEDSWITEEQLPKKRSRKKAPIPNQKKQRN